MRDNIAIYEPVSIAKDVRGVANWDVFKHPIELNPLSDKIYFLNQIQRIQENWDGYGAKAPVQATIENAIRLLKYLPNEYQKMLNTDELSITPYGTVTMDWAKNENSYISIEIGSTKIGFFSKTLDKSNPYKEKLDLVPNAISDEILPVFFKVFSNNKELVK